MVNTKKTIKKSKVLKGKEKSKKNSKKHSKIDSKESSKKSLKETRTFKENLEDLEDLDDFIYKDIKISEIITRYPEVIPVLMGYGLGCIGCSNSEIDTLEEGAKIHSIDDRTLKMMIQDMNILIRECKEENSGKNKAKNYF